MIRFDAVRYTYSAAESAHPAVRGVSFALRTGESLAILGPNGSGKSTLVRLANGLLLPESGRVTIDEVDTADSTRTRDVRTAVGVVFQRPDDQIVATSVEDDVAFGPENLGLPRAEIRRRVDECLQVVGLRGFERREPHLLSGGQKQRLAIAGALAMSPRYLVLDEPTSMIDPGGRDEVLEVVDALRRSGHGIIHVTHDVTEALRADRVLVMVSGECVFEGEASRLLGPDVDLLAWGLERPPVALMSRILRDAGVELDWDELDPSAIVGALCR